MIKEVKNIYAETKEFKDEKGNVKKYNVLYYDYNGIKINLTTGANDKTGKQLISMILTNLLTESK